MQETIKKCIESIDVLNKQIPVNAKPEHECAALVAILERLESAEKKSLELAHRSGGSAEGIARAMGAT